MGSCMSAAELEHSDDTSFLISYEDSVVSKGIESDRKATDKPVLWTFGAFLVILAACLIYCSVNGDVNRLIHGYDDCGNICGEKNENIPEYSCSGKDMTLLPILKIDTVSYSKECVKSCPSEGYIQIFYQCIMKRDEHDTSPDNISEYSLFNDLALSWRPIVGLSFLSVAICGILLLLLRYATAFYVWISFITIGALLISVTVGLWVWFINADLNKSANFIAAPILFTIFSVILLLIIICCRKRINLSIQILKEAAKSIMCMPLIVFQPVATYATFFAVLWFFAYNFIIISTAGFLTENENGSSTYQPDKFINLIFFFNIFVMCWFVQFIIGCQHMIVAGAVAKWFFTRDKSTLSFPVLNSTKNLVRYHLGTVALGSLIIAVVQFIKILLRFIESTLKRNSLIYFITKCCINWIFETLEQILKYFSRLAYIETAIYGTPFCQSGKRAVKLLLSNIYQLVAINCVTDFVLSMGKLLAVGINVLVGYAIFRNNPNLHQYYVQLFIIGLITLCVAQAFFTIYEMAIDTILLCFCEDMNHNDGMARPYFMSKELMEFVQKSDKLIKKKVPRNESATSNPTM